MRSATTSPAATTATTTATTARWAHPRLLPLPHCLGSLTGRRRLISGRLRGTLHISSELTAARAELRLGYSTL